MDLSLWPHQERARTEFHAAHAAGRRRVCLTIPTGGGKTRTAAAIIRDFHARQERCVFYCHRKMLLEQTSRVFTKLGIEHGIRAAGFRRDDLPLLQLASVQTERSRSLGENPVWDVENVRLAVFDEAHLHNNDTGARLIGHHLDQGAVTLGLTATPIDMGDIMDTLIVGGRNSELRSCGALVRAEHFGPDEPAIVKRGRMALGSDMESVTEKELKAAIMAPGIFGRVLEWYARLNPDQRPTILFAPDVPSSIWFAEQFQEAGIPAAHIDGDNAWIGGELVRSDRETRDAIMDASKAGKIKVVCNRFVLREGIDAPWISHLILATTFNSLQSYLQSGGRGLRSCTGKDKLTVQDHGGNWWRHGSLNEDRQWDLSMSSRMLAGLREWHLEHKTTPADREPMRCSCGRIVRGTRCPCGITLDPRKRSRPVIQSDGREVLLFGEIFPERTRFERPGDLEHWIRCYWRAKASKKRPMTFRQAVGMFIQERHHHPPENWPFMPKEPADWFRLVGAVPYDALIPSPDYGKGK